MVRELGGGLEAVDALHDQVENDDVGAQAMRELDPLPAAGRRVHPVSGLRELDIQIVVHLRVVVDDQHRRAIEVALFRR